MFFKSFYEKQFSRNEFSYKFGCILFVYHTVLLYRIAEYVWIVIQERLEVGVVHVGTSIIQYVIAAISNVIKVCPVHCVGRRTDISPRRPWFSAICVKSKYE
jgi:hypothetical protein